MRDIEAVGHDSVGARLRSVVDRAHDAFIAMDAGGFVVDWNPAAERILGWSREEAVGKVLSDLIIPEPFREAHLQGLQRYLATGEGPVLGRRIELSAVRRDGSLFPIELTIAVEPSPTGPRFFAFLHDISERRVNERLLRAQAAVADVFARAHDTEDAVDGLLRGLGTALDWSLGAWWSSNEAGDALRCRAVWLGEGMVASEFEKLTRELEFAPGVGLPGRVWASGEPAWIADIASDPNFPRGQAAADIGLRSGVCVPVVGDLRIEGAIEFFSRSPVDPDGGMREILSTVAAQIGGFVSLLAERSALVAKLERLALTDELTGLANRRAWEDALRRELSRAARESHPLCVGLLDLDHFKRFNDALGHQAGDRLLRDTAGIWAGSLRASDVLARYGGEEFGVLLPAWPVEVALSVIERLRSSIPDGQTCSAGLAMWDGAEDAESLVRRADAALYEAKSGGRDRSVVAPG